MPRPSLIPLSMMFFSRRGITTSPITSTIMRTGPMMNADKYGLAYFQYRLIALCPFLSKSYLFLHFVQVVVQLLQQYRQRTLLFLRKPVKDLLVCHFENPLALLHDPVPFFCNGYLVEPVVAFIRVPADEPSFLQFFQRHCHSCRRNVHGPCYVVL